MPTLKETIAESQTTFSAEIENFIQPNNSNKIENFKKELNDVSFSVNQESAVAEMVIQHAMEKNVAIQETQEFLEDYIPNRKEYSYDKKPQEYNLYKIIDASFDRYTVDEIKTRRRTLNAFNKKISEKKPKFQDKMIQGIFDDNNIQQDTNDAYNLDK
jgi:hypothetical protein